MAESIYLILRGNTWHFRRRVPLHLLPVIGKTFIKKSLETADFKVAKIRRNAMSVETDAQFAAAETTSAAPVGHFPATSSLAALTEHLRSGINLADEKTAARLLVDPPEDEEQRAEMKTNAEIELQILKNRDDPRGDQWISQAVEKAVTETGANLTDHEIATSVAEMVRRSLMELQRRKLDRYSDRHDRTFHDPLFDPSRPSSISFGELSAIFVAEKLKDFATNGVRQKSVDRIKSASAYLSEVIGDAVPVRLIGDEAIQNARELIAATPSNRNKVYPGQPLRKQVERASKDGKPLLSANTQGAYIDILRDVLKVAVRKRLIVFNPAEDVKPLKRETLAPEEKRKPWTPDQLAGFFQGGFYRSCVPAAEQPYSRSDRPWRFWLPLLMLFSGARPGEILQLETGDIRQTVLGTWFMDLMNEDDSKRLKTASSRRRVPLHPQLISFGFLAFVEERRKHRKETGPRLFSGIKPDKYGSLTDRPSKAFSRSFIPAEIQLGERQALYSLRHNVRDALRRAKAPPEALRHICGWSDGKNVADDYGDPGNPDLMAEWVNGIAYPGLNLDYLHGAKT